MQMSMKYPIDIRKAIYASVVPVRCDNERGTAFFIAPDTLVTARHIVAQNAVNSVPVIISTDKQVLCGCCVAKMQGLSARGLLKVAGCGV